jgi:hypothetical protein
VLLSWSASAPCGPVHGSIGGSYFAAGGSPSWIDYINTASGTYLDTVPKEPGNTAECTVDVAYTLAMGGTKEMRQAFATVHIC